MKTGQPVRVQKLYEIESAVWFRAWSLDEIWEMVRYRVMNTAWANVVWRGHNLTWDRLDDLV